MPTLPSPSTPQLIVPESVRQPVVLANSPEWWRERLLGKIRAKAKAIQRYRDYYDGRHDLAFAGPKFKEAFGGLFEEFAANVCPLVVDSAAELLQVQGFRFGGGEDADAEAWEMWQRNGLDAESALLHTETVKVGEGYALVSAGEDPMWPRVTIEDPAQCEVEMDPAVPRRRLAGMKCWQDPISGRLLVTLWLPHAIYRWSGTQSRGSDRIAWSDRSEPEANALGIVPLVPYLNAPSLYGGRSDLHNVIPLLKAMEKTCMDMVVTAEFNSFRQRLFSGIGEMRDQFGNPIKNFDEVLSATRVLTIPGDDVKVHDLAPSDPGLYIKVLNWFLGQIAAVSSTPLPFFNLDTAVFPASGEALKVANYKLVNKDRRKCVDLGESHEEIARLMFLARGDRERGQDYSCETIWADLETRTDAQVADKLVKLNELGLPKKALWKMIPGATEATVARWIKEAEEETAAAATVTSLTNLQAGNVFANAGGEQPAPEAGDALTAPTIPAA